MIKELKNSVVNKNNTFINLMNIHKIAKYFIWIWKYQFNFNFNLSFKLIYLEKTAIEPPDLFYLG